MNRLAVLAAVAAPLWAAPLSFELRDTSGALHTQQEWRNKKAVVVFFIMTDCPLANGYVPEMNRIRAEYEARGVAVYAAHSDPLTGAEAVRRHAAEFGYTFPVLLDPDLKLARWTGATIVPQAALLSPDGEVLYLGRIDNRMEEITRRRPEPTQRELRDALEAVLAGRKPAVARTRAVGCNIDIDGVLKGTQ
jgi:peroxiredoxin